MKNLEGKGKRKEIRDGEIMLLHKAEDEEYASHMRKEEKEIFGLTVWTGKKLNFGLTHAKRLTYANKT